MIRKITLNSNLDFNRYKILKDLDNYGYLLINGLFDRGNLRSKLKIIKEKYSSLKEHSSLSGNPKLIQNNFHKFCVGSASHNGQKVYRLHRVIYNPLWSQDLFKLRDIFLKLCFFRNKLLGFEKNYCTLNIENNLWSACRIMQYPLGGGHMSEHKDNVVNKISKKNNIKNFYQIILNLTERGKDFSNGGAYIKVKGKFIDLEKYAQSGDIIIYKSRLIHGVKEIDPNKKLNTKKMNGRIILMNNLYQDFTKKKDKSKFYK